MSLLISIFLTLSVYAANVVPATEMQIEGCEDIILNGTPEPRYRFPSLEIIDGLPANATARPWVKDSVLQLFSKTMAQKRRFPTAQEIDEHLNRFALDEEQLETADRREKQAAKLAEEMIADHSLIVGPKGLFKDHLDLAAQANRRYPEIFSRIYALIQRQAFLFFRHRLRPPTFSELGSFLRYEDLRVLQAYVHQPRFWDDALRSQLGNHIDFAKTRVLTAYARAVRGTDTPAEQRTRRVRPLLRRVVEIMVMTKSNLQYRWRAFASTKSPEATIDAMTAELEALLGIKPMANPGRKLEDQWMFEMPTLFPGGIDELHMTAEKEYQPTFRSYVELEKFPDVYAEKVRAAITEAKGVLVSSVIPGLKVDWDLVDGMVRMSRETGHPIVLMSTTGTFKNVDPKLFEIPEILFLTATISNNSIRFANIPGQAQDPFAQFLKPGRIVNGQQLIVPHHVLKFAAVPTTTNHLDQTQLYSTGVINLPEIGSVGAAQLAKAELIRDQMKRSFLVVDKADRGEGDMGGVSNSWLIRPVEFRPAGKGEPSSFVDVDTAYVVGPGTGPERVQKLVELPRHFFLFDLHFVTADPLVLNALREYIRRKVPAGARITFIFPDPLDNQNNNAHVEKKQQNRAKLHWLFRTGQLSFEDELNDVTANTNVLLEEFPQAEVVFQYDNHSQEWIDRNLINQPSFLQTVANGPVASEIQTAMSNNPEWKTPLEYLLVHRQAYLSRSSLSGSDAFKKGRTFISDPSRVRVMRRNEPLSSADVNPIWDISLPTHGHEGANGARSSFKTHIMSTPRSFTGDAHREGYEGHGSNMWIGVGASAFKQNYTGPISSWGVGFGVATSRNTMTLVQLEPNSASFLQREDIGVLEPDEFFGEDPLLVVGAMDDDERRRQVDSENFEEWFAAKRGWITDGRLAPPAFDAESDPSDLSGYLEE